MNQPAAQISSQAYKALTLEQALQEIAKLERTIKIYKQTRGDLVQVSKNNYDRALQLEQSNRTLRLAVDLAVDRDKDIAEALTLIIVKAHTRNYGEILTLASAALRRFA